MEKYRTQLPELLIEQNSLCNGCMRQLKYPGAENGVTGSPVWSSPGIIYSLKAEVDHIWPVFKKEAYTGDIHEYANLQALCPICNFTKSDESLCEWMSRMEPEIRRVAIGRMNKHLARRNRYFVCIQHEENMILFQRSNSGNYIVAEWNG